MEIQFSGNPKPFGVIGLVLAILSCLFSLIPCVGFYAFIPATLSIIFCLIAFLYLRQIKASTSVPLAGLIIGMLAVSIATFQYFSFKDVYDEKKETETLIKDRIEKKVLEGAKEVIEEKLKDDSIQKIRRDSLPQ